MYKATCSNRACGKSTFSIFRWGPPSSRNPPGKPSGSSISIDASRRPRGQHWASETRNSRGSDGFEVTPWPARQRPSLGSLVKVQLNMEMSKVLRTHVKLEKCRGKWSDPSKFRLQDRNWYRFGISHDFSVRVWVDVNVSLWGPTKWGDRSSERIFCA